MGRFCIYGFKTIETKLDGLQEEFDSKLHYDQQKKEIIDRQAEELSQYHKGLLEQNRNQIFKDLIPVIDDIRKLATHYSGSDVLIPENASEVFSKLLKIYESTAVDLCELLEKYDVSSFECQTGTPFDPKTQRIISSESTSDPTKDKTIKKSLRLGFRTTEKIIRPEWVAVYRYVLATEENSTNTGD